MRHNIPRITNDDGNSKAPERLRKHFLRVLVHLAPFVRIYQLDESSRPIGAPAKPGRRRGKKLQEPKVIREVSSAEPVDLSGSLLPGKREGYSNSHPPAACFTRRH